jgi:hypothetical protein
MAVTSLTRDGVATYARYTNMSAGNVIGPDPQFIMTAGDLNYYTSSDGLTWSQKLSGFVSNTDNNIVKYNNVYYIGRSDGTYFTTTFVSPTQIGNDNVVDSKIFNNILYTLINDSGGSQSALRASTFRQTNNTAPTVPIDMSWNGVDTLVIVGNAGIKTKVLTPSTLETPAFTITGRSSPVAGQITQVTFGNSMFVAANSNNLIYSSNGTTWTVSQAGNFTSVRFANGLFVATGYPGIIYTSTNGTAWTSRLSAGGTIDIANPAFGNGIWVAADRNSSNAIYTSTNGTSWTARAFGFAVSAKKVFFQ